MLGEYSLILDESSKDGTLLGRGGRWGAGPLPALRSSEGLSIFPLDAFSSGSGHCAIGAGLEIAWPTVLGFVRAFDKAAGMGP